MFPFEFVSRSLTAAYRDTTLAYTVFAIEIIFIALVTALEAGGFLVVAGLVLKRLSKSKSLTATEQAHRAFTKVSGFMLVCAAMMLITLIAAGIFLTTDSAETYLVLCWIARLAEYTSVCVLLYVFHIPRKPKHNVSSDLELNRKSSVNINTTGTTQN